MIKIKFLQFYNKLDKAELKEFRKFALSDYFSGGRDFKNFLSAVEKYSQKNLSSKEFISALSSSLGITQRTVWNRLHELMKTADIFAALKEIQRNRLKFSKITGGYYLNKNSYNLFEQKYKASIKTYRKSKKNVDSIYNFYEMLQSGGYYYIFTNRSDEYLENLNEQIIYHSAAYMINHYLHLTELLQTRNLTAKELAQKGMSFLTDGSVESFLGALKANKNDLYYMVAFHYYIYKAFLSKNDDSHYLMAKECFDKAYPLADESYKGIFYQILINYCINRTNLNDRHYYTELFELYNRKLEDGLYQDLKVGNFPINNFRDYIFVALQLGKIEWIKWFIEKYSTELPENVRKDEVNLSWGIVHYNEGNNVKAMEFLNSVAGENYIHYMDSRYYKMRLFYETEQWEEVIMETDNNKHYLRAHKEIPDNFKRPYKHFLNEFSQLVKIRLKEKTEDAVLLKKDLLTKAQTPRRMWIIRKLDEIIKPART
jgi:hypothetical protein